MISRVRTIEADDTGNPGSPATPGSPGEDLVRFACNGLSRLTNAICPTPDQGSGETPKLKRYPTPFLPRSTAGGGAAIPVVALFEQVAVMP